VDSVASIGSAVTVASLLVSVGHEGHPVTLPRALHAPDAHLMS